MGQNTLKVHWKNQVLFHQGLWSSQSKPYFLIIWSTHIEQFFLLPNFKILAGFKLINDHPLLNAFFAGCEFLVALNKKYEVLQFELWKFQQEKTIHANEASKHI